MVNIMAKTFVCGVVTFFPNNKELKKIGGL